MNKNNKNWEVCVELLNEITTNAQWDKNKFTCNDYIDLSRKVSLKVFETMEVNGWNTPEKCKVFTDFYDTLHYRLIEKLKKYWFNGTLLDGKYRGDDDLYYFTDDILSHGYDVYCEVMEDWTAAKRYTRTYFEGFSYCFPTPDCFNKEAA